MSKGSAKQAATQTGINNAYASSFNKSGIQDRSTLFPFLQNEISNPQGLGQPAVQDMLTQGGQAVSGATGAADEKSALLASRTGNTAALPGAIDTNARSAMGANSDNALSVAIQNAKLKQQQQQTGVSQLGSLYGEDTGDVLKSLGLTNQSIGDWTQAQTAADNQVFQYAKLGAQGAGTLAGG